MTKALETVTAEHRNIGKVLRCLEAEVKRLASAKNKPDLELLHSIVYYIRVFPDRYHHPKEEQYLFSALRKRRPEAIPILDELASQHDRLAGFLEEVDSALRHYEAHYPQGLEELEGMVAAYLEFQWKHMRTEEDEILPLAEEALREEDWARINSAFQRNTDPVFGDNLALGFNALYQHITKHAHDEHR